MFSFQVRNRQNGTASPRAPIEPASPCTPAAVGEIDTKPPFESVKAAVTLFVEASPKADPSRPLLKKSSTLESVLGKETQLHWMLKEIDKYKEHLKTAESTKVKALGDLEKTNKTLEELTKKLEATSQSKQVSIQSTEAANTQAEQLKSTKDREPTWQQTVDNERNQYKAAANQLISVKQQLNNLKQDFNLALEVKLSSFQRAAEAQHSAKVNRKKIKELSKDVDQMSQTLERVKYASARAEEDHDKLVEEKESLLESNKKAKDDTEIKLQCLRKQDLADDGNIEKRLEETSEAVNVLREQLKEVRDADMELLRNANSELDEAKKRLDEMKEEEASLKDEVESLKQELENVRRDISLSKEDDLKNERLQDELDGIKREVEEATTKNTISTNDVNELESKIHEMSLETEKARKREAELRRQVETFWIEAQHSELAIKESEEKLEIAQREVEQAKAAKDLADDQIRRKQKDSFTTSMIDDDDSSYPAAADGDDDNNIMLTPQDFEALNKKVEETTSAADTKVETIMAQVETIKEKERGILEKLEKGIKENKEIQEEINKAQKTGDLADAARQTLETEVKNLRKAS